MLWEAHVSTGSFLHPAVSSFKTKDTSCFVCWDWFCACCLKLGQLVGTACCVSGGLPRRENFLFEWTKWRCIRFKLLEIAGALFLLDFYQTLAPWDFSHKFTWSFFVPQHCLLSSFKSSHSHRWELHFFFYVRLDERTETMCSPLRVKPTEVWLC